MPWCQIFWSCTKQLIEQEEESKQHSSLPSKRGHQPKQKDGSPSWSSMCCKTPLKEVLLRARLFTVI
ncbi:hypothetical protein AMECASPLE_033776 [Ameca splendens]|uniref:Uncharacterized protein n=1 Tax=Ameca splendens TaxID=208324 RepID=A0ABV0XVU4_9TELE